MALDAVWGSGTSLIDPVIDPDESHGGVEVEGLPTNAPLSHSFNYLQRQVLGHPFVLIRVIRARGLMSKGARSVVKASNPSCTFFSVALFFFFYVSLIPFQKLYMIRYGASRLLLRRNRNG